MFTKIEKTLFKKIKESNTDTLFIWNVANVGFPMFTVFITFLFFCYTSKSSAIANYYALIFNGVVPLIAINIIVAASFFLIKFNKEKEEKYGLQTSNTRLKLILYAFGSYLLSSSLFAIQNISSPFLTPWTRWSQITLSFFAVYIALNISNKLFLLQEEMIENSYDKVITDNVKNLKGAIE
ncbi:hypothetical protein MUY27_13960 [Mucilaginibacter sp. RS28]|uniref:Uncharacterized protein n=1 Tax=Mucilaginibacter straminoryzae TaxID=2932774 RepID=A0A9X1X4H9_9SPHI|nr:hypothetical protein [Mucilaginibacter straminoryzae]MCJ8210818.1 hypothetical protein [Mucilaginibacter straminoryzae]